MLLPLHLGCHGYCLHPCVQGSWSQLSVCILLCCLVQMHMFHHQHLVMMPKQAAQHMLPHKLSVGFCLASVPAYLAAYLTGCVARCQVGEYCISFFVCYVQLCSSRMDVTMLIGWSLQLLMHTGSKLFELVACCTKTALVGTNVLTPGICLQ